MLQPARLVPTAAFAFLLIAPLSAQDRAADRRRFLAPTTRTTDDPRRIPIGPGPRGPDGTIVLRGARIFDGTGAAARPGTLVIERNQIKAILGPESTDWPKDARVLDATGMTVMSRARPRLRAMRRAMDC